MPEFRLSHILRVAGLVAVSLVFLGCAFVDNIRDVAIIAAVGTAMEILLRFSVGIAVAIERKRQLKERDNHLAAGRPIEHFQALKQRKLPAFNLEHMVERTAAFVTVVLGESVVSLLYTASRGSYGLSR